ncbi:streptophobe family protein [Streptomyces sp. NPDC000348]|uniref:streptophobe family protein n=1 Tax=Streptomyces sp. NPDC000348 TaxID=3364538 RepID=UPI00368D6F5A
MSTATDVRTAERGGRVPWADVVMSAVAAVSWALIGMAGTAALGLRLLDADAAGSLGPMTAAVVALGAGGSATPSGDGSAFGLSGAEAGTAVEVTPLGVGLVGALLLSYFFLRSLRAAGVVVSGTELLARAGAVVGLFVAMTGGPARAGDDVVTVDGGLVGTGRPAGDGRWRGRDPGAGRCRGLLPDRVGDLVDAEAAVGFTVDTVPTLFGGLGWAAGVLLVALPASRRTPLPRGWDAVHRAVRPAVSALVTVGLVAVAANASLSVLGFDVFGAGIELRGRLGAAFLLGAVWGAGAGAAGALLAWASGAAGVRAAPPARGDTRAAGEWRPAPTAEDPGGAPAPGPYGPGVPHRPPNPDTNPYLRVGRGAGAPREPREPEDAAPGGAPGAGDPHASGVRDVHGAPTVAGPVKPPRPGPGPRGRDRSSLWPDEPTPPPPSPPPSPRKPDGS